MKMDVTGPGKDDYTCPICMYIMIHPVTMPCSHSLCMPCYKQCVEKTNLSCPLCRMRISSWARKHSRSNTLVDVQKWETIQSLFPVHVRNRLEDRESSDDEWESLHHVETELRKRKEVSKPGAIRQEYEAALAQLRKQQEEERRKEEEASAVLIRALQEEEEEEIAELERERDHNEKKGIEAARQLDKKENATSLRSASCNLKPTGASGKIKSSNKTRRGEPSLKLDTFYETIRRSSHSAPLTCERAPSPSQTKKSLSGQDRQEIELSPYPYICISPSDKVPKSPSPSECSSPEWNSHLDPHLSEHSYTTASARRIDLTSDSEFYMSCRRCDIPSNPLPTVKLEPLDTSVSPQGDQETSSSFQPIESFIRTPPHKLPSGQSLEPSLVRVRAVQRNLGFDDQQYVSPPSVTAGSGAEQTESNCELSKQSHLQASDESTKMFPGGISDKESGCKVFRHLSKEKKFNERSVSETASSCSSVASPSRIIGVDVECKNSDELEMEDKVECADDNIITSDTPLLIPLEPDLSVCNIENEFQPLLFTGGTPVSESTEPIVKNASGGKPMLQEPRKRGNFHLQANNSDSRSNSVEITSCSEAATSKGKTASKTKTTSSKGKKSRTDSNISIRQFCVPTNVCINSSNSRKRKAEEQVDKDILAFETTNSGVVVGNHCDNRSAQEEADRIFAMQLQNMYSTLDKHGIAVDRYKGSKDEYSFRKRSCR